MLALSLLAVVGVCIAAVTISRASRGRESRS